MLLFLFLDAGPVMLTPPTSADCVPSSVGGEPNGGDEDEFEDAEVGTDSWSEPLPPSEPRLMRSCVTFQVSAVFHAQEPEAVEACSPVILGEDNFSARPLPTRPAPPRPPRQLGPLRWQRPEPAVGPLPIIREEDFSPVDLSVDLK